MIIYPNFSIFRKFQQFHYYHLIYWTVRARSLDLFLLEFCLQKHIKIVACLLKF